MALEKRSIENLKGRLMTRTELANALAWDYRTVDRAVKAGDFQAKRVGKTLFIDGDSVAKHLATNG